MDLHQRPRTKSTDEWCGCGMCSTECSLVVVVAVVMIFFIFVIVKEAARPSRAVMAKL